MRPYNYGGWSDPEYDRLLRAAEDTRELGETGENRREGGTDFAGESADGSAVLSLLHLFVEGKRQRPDPPPSRSVFSAEICLCAGLLINQKMGGGRESCAAIARPGSGSDLGETCTLWVQSNLVPWALQSKGAEALDEGSHPTQRRIWREGV